MDPQRTLLHINPFPEVILAKEFQFYAFTIPFATTTWYYHRVDRLST